MSAAAEAGPTQGGGAAAAAAQAEAARERRERQLRSAQADAKQMQAQVGELRQQYEKERREWQEKEQALLQEVRTLQLRDGYREAVAAGRSLSELQVDGPTLERITAEIREQEALIGAFQKENERLAEELKAAREETRAARAAAEARDEEMRRLALLASQAETRRGDGDATEELQGHLERARSDAAEAASQAQLREVEMRCDIDRLRTAKRELEARLAGVDLHLMEQEHDALRDAQEAARRTEASHAKELSGLRAKLAWYVENQQLIDEAEARCGASYARARQLECCLAAANLVIPPPPSGPPDEAAAVTLHGAGGVARLAPADGAAKDGASWGGGGGGGSEMAIAVAAAAAAKPSERERERFTAFEEKVVTLQGLLQQEGGRQRDGGGKGWPNVGVLVAAAGPSPEQLARQQAQQQRIVALEAQCAANDKKVRTLRQQHERVVAAHEARAAALEEQLKRARFHRSPRSLLHLPASCTCLPMPPVQSKQAQADKGGGGGRTRLRELERQVEEVRATHGKKVRRNRLAISMQTFLSLLRTTPPHRCANLRPNSPRPTRSASFGVSPAAGAPPCSLATAAPRGWRARPWCHTAPQRLAAAAARPPTAWWPPRLQPRRLRRAAQRRRNRHV